MNKKFLKEVKKAKKDDIIIWNEATGELIRGQPNSRKINEAVIRLFYFIYDMKNRKFRKLKWDNLFDYIHKKCNLREVKGKLTWTCYGDLKFVKEFCNEYNLPFEKIKKRLNAAGGYCDCEVLLNSMAEIDKNEYIL